jgi:antitoxin (DNA-binding transcriptional repressor) of toxin-antitoxin stability system
MTSCDYLVTMKGVGIADLKSRLSEHLRKVRRGRTIVVLDRNRPIAEIVPWHGDEPRLVIRPPRPGSRPLRELELPPPLETSHDIVAILLEDRQSGR